MPDASCGAVMLFRRAKAPPSLTVSLIHIDVSPEADYAVDYFVGYERNNSRAMSGTELAALAVELPLLEHGMPASLLIEYRRSSF